MIVPSRRSIALCVLLVLTLGWLGWRSRSSNRTNGRTPLPSVDRQPVNFVTRTFDPADPPLDMPPLTPGENAECDSEFLSNARVVGETRKSDATHATVTITRVAVTLQLNISIWAPADASTHVIEHEEGHRQISESYYRTADKIAEQIAAPYNGKQVEISGADLNAESNKLLQQMAGEITEEYRKELNPEAAQLLYDNITDHSRNEVSVQDAVAHALKNVAVESSVPPVGETPISH
jgi:hypothetical protein